MLCMAPRFNGEGTCNRSMSIAHVFALSISSFLARALSSQVEPTRVIAQ